MERITGTLSDRLRLFIRHYATIDLFLLYPCIPYIFTLVYMVLCNGTKTCEGRGWGHRKLQDMVLGILV